MPPEPLHIRQRILYPSLITFIIIATFVVGALLRQQSHQLNQEIDKAQTQTEQSFHSALNKDAELYTALINFIAQSTDLQQAWLKQDRNTFLELANPIFLNLKQQHRVTHFYLHDPEGINIARAHSPNRFGDAIQRSTLKNARQSGKISWGVEVGTYGWFVLRVVKPWVIDGEIIGYLEIGEEIDHIIKLQAHDLLADLIITIPKNRIEKNQWNISNPNPHHPWNTLPRSVISSSTILSPSIKLLSAINQNKPLESSHTDVNLIGKSYRVTSSPILDADKRYSGQLHSIIDISSQFTRRKEIFNLLMFAAVIIGLLLTLMGYMLVIRVERQLNKNYRKLETEVEERRIAQEETSRLKEELEFRIENRTRQLQNLNQQLIQDNEERRQTEIALSASEERYRTLFDTSADAMILLDNNRIIECNNAFIKLLGYKTRSQVIGQHARILSPDKQPNGVSSVKQANIEAKKAREQKSNKLEWTAQRANNEVFPVEASLTSIKYGDRQFIHVTVIDITERKQAESKVIQHAYFDTLTGLPNRNLFMDRLEQALEHNKRMNIQGSVLFADLDHFKNVNDSLGHDKGDLLLKEVARRLRRAIRKEDTVARFGGDEFVILLPTIDQDYSKAIRTTQRVAEKVRKSFTKPFKVKPYEFHLTPSIGATLFPSESDSMEDIIKHADAAMYQAKSSGRNTIRFFEKDMQRSLEQRLKLEKDLRTALRRKEFSLVFQPQVDAKGIIIGAETLTRWNHPKSGPISPVEFIPVAEETGLIIQLGQWIMEESLNFFQKLDQLEIGSQKLHLSINVSPLQFRQSDIVNNFSEALLSRNIPSERLTLEITEGILMDDITESSDKLEQLKELGIRISIDDFGTGYSSLAYLKQLNIDELKIDRSFIRDISSDPNDAAIVEAIISMSHHLGLRVIAEGVEENPQLAFLLHQKCDAFQGYYFYRPLAEDEFIEALQQNNPEVSGLN
jgi:diguanylate cyclase (GGDEF)-like protein/PAS domain S-box-containing protein